MTPIPPLKCELEDCSGCTDRHSEGTHAMHTKQHPCPEGGDPNCGYCFPTTETKHPDSCTASVKEPSYMHSEMCPLRRSTTKTKPYKSWEETWLEDVPTPSPVVKWEWKKIFKRELSDIAPPTGYKNVEKYCISFITTLLHDEMEKERERIVKMCEEMKQIGDDHLGSQQNGCTYCWGVKQHNKALSDLRDKLTNNV